MADCKDIDSALNNLAGKVDNFNSKFKGLEDRVKKNESCCSNKLKQEEGKKEQDLSAILARLSKLEKALTVLAENEKNNYKFTEEMAKTVISLNSFLKMFEKMFNFNFEE